MNALKIPEGLPVSYKSYEIANTLIHALSESRETWKYPIESYKTNDENLANEISDIFNYYLGGSEIYSDGKSYNVASLGYYHYIGA